VIKNLEVNNNSNFQINKLFIHKIVGLLKNEFNFNISSLLINFITADQIKKINKDFLNHKNSTDIITFNYSKMKLNIDSEIYISAEDADSNAKKYGVTFIQEILRLVIHGVLHLLGFDDKVKKDRVKMKQAENKLFKKYCRILLNAEIN
jgi:probable rRNA maturation factor